MKKPASMKPVAKAGGAPKAAPKTVAKSSGSKASPAPSYAEEDKKWKTRNEAMAKEQAQKLSGLCGKAK
ncbi:hypothetical protein ATY75_12190 [Rhizobium sp. N122]|uniref:hypothetical protein n=1 Tax=Rhizobium sp. N122 TaxID=1764272 RepID=UPI000B5ABBB3|nr:hypothetical protein [Rhizobium sp. N122]OWV62576.1 hypothetical protein ATY75_12190 [Rhizobium sp. N122]